MLAAVIHAQPVPARRVKVALVGDSVVEGSGAPRGDLATWVRWELRRLGVAVGADGYVAAHTSTFTTAPDGALSSFPWTYSPTWALDGLGLGLPSAFGANGRMSETSDPAAIATAQLAGDRFAVLFAHAPDAGRFTFSVDDRTVTVDARSTHIDGSGIRSVSAPEATPSKHLVTIGGPQGGTLRFTGVVASMAVAPGTDQVEVSGVGQACACATDPLPRTRAEALALLRPDITLLMLGLNGEGQFLATGDRHIETEFVAGLERRERIAKRHRGICVVVPHAPDPRPPDAQRLFARLARKAAKARGCAFAPVLDRLWDGGGSARLGLTSDGIHPTPRGYRRMAGRLARLILSVARLRP